MKPCAVAWCASTAVDGLDVCTVHKLNPVGFCERREAWLARIAREQSAKRAEAGK